MRCCIQPGCHVKTRRDFEVEFYQQALQWDKDGRVTRMPILQKPLGLMAHTEGSEVARVSSVGADLKVRVMDMVEFRIGKNASPEMIHLLLNLDEKYRKTAAQKVKDIAAKTVNLNEAMFAVGVAAQKASVSLNAFGA